MRALELELVQTMESRSRNVCRGKYLAGDKSGVPTHLRACPDESMPGDLGITGPSVGLLVLNGLLMKIGPCQMSNVHISCDFLLTFLAVSTMTTDVLAWLMMKEEAEDPKVS